MARKEQRRPPAPFPGPPPPAHFAPPYRTLRGTENRRPGRPRRAEPPACEARVSPVLLPSEHLGLDAHLGRVLRFGLNENSS